MDKEIAKPIEFLPVSFRVICVGKEMSGVFRSIISLGFEGVSVQSTIMFPDPTPTDENKMVILLSNGDSEQLESIARSFYQAGVLTLIISTSNLRSKHVQCDSLTVSPIDDMPEIVKAILNPILSDSYLTLDYMDISVIFKDSCHFKVYESYGCGIGNRIENAIDCMPAKLSVDIMNCERALITLSFSEKMLPQLTISQIESVKKYINRFPVEVDIIWLPVNDVKLPTDRIRLGVIVAGKELKL